MIEEAQGGKAMYTENSSVSSLQPAQMEVRSVPGRGSPEVREKDTPEELKVGPMAGLIMEDIGAASWVGCLEIQ